MRHSTITLTLDTYGHLIEGAEAAAVKNAASLTAVPNMAATGTDGKLDHILIPKRVHTGCMDGANAILERPVASVFGDSKKPHSPRELGGFVHLNEAEDTGLEPATGEPATDFESAS